MGLYTFLKPCLKGENTNITENDLKLIFSENINFFQKVKNLLRWNILKQHAQWFSCKVAAATPSSVLEPSVIYLNKKKSDKGYSEISCK